MTTKFGFWEYLLFPSSLLVECGVSSDAVADLRFAETGHVRPAPATWAEAYFYWGGVSTAAQIAEMTEHETAQARQYAKDAGLRYATRDRQRTHAELAVLLWCDRRRSPVASCRRFGVPPGARRVLCSAMQVITETNGVKEVLEWKLSKLELEFSALSLELTPPRGVVAAARAAVAPACRAA